MRQLPKRNARRIGLVVIALALAVTTLFWWARSREEEGALAGLAVDQRRLLFSRELASFHEICRNARRDARLLTRCRERAEFIVRFPECDSSCRYVAQTVLPAAGR